ncbi:MAG: DUF416 family protein [Bacteroidales bacterium]|nr:DUF416 family protein [Bacteroidales bacterium]
MESKKPGLIDIYRHEVWQIFARLHNWHKVVYALYISRNLYSYYKSFADSTGTGNPSKLCLAEKMTYNWLVNKEFDKNVFQDLHDELGYIIPDCLEYYDCQDAMDAVVVHQTMLDLVYANKNELIEMICCYVFDHFNRRTKKALKLDIFLTSRDRQKIEKHPLLVNGLKSNLNLLTEAYIPGRTVETIDNFLDKENIFAL